MTELSDPPFDPEVHDPQRPSESTLAADEAETTPTANTSRLPHGARAFFDWIVVVGVALLVAVLVRTFLLAHFVVEGTSMFSTLDTGDRVFVNKQRALDLAYGAIVVFRSPENPGVMWIKRVAGLSGARTHQGQGHPAGDDVLPQ